MPHKVTESDPTIAKARPVTALPRPLHGGGPVIAARSPSEFVAETLRETSTRRLTGSLVTGLLDVVLVGMVGLIRRSRQSGEREQELLAELVQARRGLHRMEERDHELRNAVESVRVLVSLLSEADGVDAEDGRRVSLVTQAELCRIGRLLEKGAEPGPLEDYVLRPVVEAAVLAHGDGMDVEIDVPAHLVVRGCPSTVTHVVSNLLSNSRRYAAGSGVRVRARGDGEGITLEVADDGARPGTTSWPGGVGIGLSICRRLLRAEDGRVEAPEDRPDGGCTVRVALKAAS
jgi:signal transduction histidine kinase